MAAAKALSSFMAYAALKGRSSTAAPTFLVPANSGSSQFLSCCDYGTVEAAP